MTMRNQQVDHAESTGVGGEEKSTEQNGRVRGTVGRGSGKARGLFRPCEEEGK